MSATGALHLAFASDARYLPHAAALMHSAAAHGGAPLEFHLLHDASVSGSDAESLTRFARDLGADLRMHVIPEGWVEGFPALHRIPKVMWFRIFLPQLLPEVDRVLYLDCDTLVLDGLGPLFGSPLGGALLGAVRNVFEPEYDGHAQALGLSSPADYFNSGVLLMDLHAWRQAGSAARVATFARKPPPAMRWPDQDALNVVFAGQWHPLHPRWNCQNSLFLFPQARDVFGRQAVHEATRDPGVIHFEGGHLSKPWHYLSKHPYRRNYFRHRAATPWPEVEVEGRSAFNRLLRPLPARMQIAILKSTHELRRRLRGR